MSSFINVKDGGVTVKRARIDVGHLDAMDEDEEEATNEQSAPSREADTTEDPSAQVMNLEESGWTSPELEEIIQAFGDGDERVSMTFSPSRLAFTMDTFEGKSTDYATFDASRIGKKADVIMGGVESRTAVARNAFKKYMTQPNPVFETNEGTAKVSQEAERQVNEGVREIEAVRSYHTTGNRRVDTSSLGNPNNDVILRCVAAVIESEIRAGEETPGNLERNSSKFPEFDRRSGVSKDFQEKLKLAPSNKDIMYIYILYYIDWVQRKLRYYSEVNIISLAYLYRLTSMSELTVTVQN